MNGGTDQSATIPSFKEVLRAFPQWAKKNIPTFMWTVVAGGAIGYISNVWLMAVRYEGSAVPPGAAATGQGNFISGGLFWALFSSVFFGIAGYWKSVGTKKFIEDVTGLPNLIKSLFRSEGQAAWIQLLWGAATAIAASILISPATGAVLAIGILVTIPTFLSTILSSFVFRIWSLVTQKINPTKQHRTTGITSMTVGLLGASAALAISFLFVGGSTWLTKLIIAAACAGVAVLLSRQRPSATTMIFLVMTIGLVLAQLTGGTAALADDGGWIECDRPDNTILEHFEEWLTNCPGTAAVLILGILGAGPAAAMAPIGWFIGQLAGNGLKGLDRPGPGSGQQGGEPEAQGEMPSAEELNGRIGDLYTYDIYGQKGSDLYGRLEDLVKKIREQGGQMTPADLAALQQLENDYHKAAGEHDTRVAGESQQFADKGMEKMVNRLRDEEKAWIRQRDRDKAAQSILDQIKDSATKHGFDDILDRATSANVVGDDGTIDSDYVEKLKGVLRNRLANDQAAPNEMLQQGWVSDFAENTWNDARHNPWIRIGTGILSGGSSEVFYQSQAAFDKMKEMERKAAERGKDYSFTDGLRDGMVAVGEENLPINTIKAYKEGKIKSPLDLAANVGMDVMAGFGLKDTAQNIAKGVRGIRGMPGVDDVIPTRSVDPNDALGAPRTGEPTLPGERPGGHVQTEAPKPGYEGPFTKAPAGTEIPPKGLNEFGMPENNFKHVNVVADRHLVNIEVRPTNPDSIRLLSEGALPKPPTIKAKTISDIDLQLGAQAGDVGKVGYFEPKLPAGVGSVDELRNLDPKAADRFVQRANEFADQAEKMQKMVDQGTIKVENGVILDTATGKPFTGDHDLYRITSYDGKPLPDTIISGGKVIPNPIKEAVIQDLSKPPFRAQHGAHTDWVPQTTVDQGIDATVRNSHKPGGDALMTVGPGYGPATTAYDSGAL